MKDFHVQEVSEYVNFIPIIIVQVTLGEFSDRQQRKRRKRYETVEIQPTPSPIPAVQTFDEDSRQSNRSFSYDGFTNSPRTPLFVSHYEEVSGECVCSLLRTKLTRR